MDEGQLVGSLAWLGIGVGYAWTVQKLARMARAPRPSDPSHHRLLVPTPRHDAEASAAPERVRLGGLR